jgi:hypothetical protein
MATILERLQSILDEDTNVKLKEAVKAHPELLVDDAFASNILSIYEGSPASASGSATTTEPVTTVAAATHTPTVPSAATTTAAAQTVTSSTAGNNDSILAAIQGLKSSMDGFRTTTEATLKNVVTVDKLPELGRQLRSQAIRDAHLTMKIEQLNKTTFGEDLDLTKLGTFIEDQKKAGTVYPDVEKAYLAMVGDKLTDITIAKKVDEGVKQGLSAATVPGQTTSAALSASQQVIAKQKAAAANNNGTGDNVSRAIAALEQRDRANGSAQVQ